MNYLAHCALAHGDEELVVGAFLGDFIKGRVQQLPGRVALGVRLHRRIDAITAWEPGIRQSVHRFGPQLRRTAGIFVDLAADHFLACDFERYYSAPLDRFSRGVYQTLDAHRALLPDDGRRLLDHMQRTDLLTAYRDIDVLARACLRIGERLAMPGIGPRAMARLNLEYDDFANDFAGYYPVLQGHVAEWLQQQAGGDDA
jgi:acyl carrier protein phosphodiesterase